MAEHLIWESVRALRCGELRQPLKNVSVLPWLHPLSIMRIAEHRILRVPRDRPSLGGQHERLIVSGTGVSLVNHAPDARATPKSVTS